MTVRSLAMQIARSNGPDEVGFVLVSDEPFGFLEFARMSHTRGCATRIDDDPGIHQRAIDRIGDEAKKRREMGNACAPRTLVVCVDDPSPSERDMWVTFSGTYDLGALGIHLVMTSQRRTSVLDEWSEIRASNDFNVWDPDGADVLLREFYQERDASWWKANAGFLPCIG